MASPQIVVDDPTIFPTFSNILDVILMHVAPKNPLIAQYLASVNTSVSISVLLSKETEGSSKASKVPKKKKKVEKPPTIEEEVMNEIIPSKSGTLKHTTKLAKKPHHYLVKQSL